MHDVRLSPVKSHLRDPYHADPAHGTVAGSWRAPDLACPAQDITAIRTPCGIQSVHKFRTFACCTHLHMAALQSVRPPRSDGWTIVQQSLFISLC